MSNNQSRSVEIYERAEEKSCLAMGEILKAGIRLDELSNEEIFKLVNEAYAKADTMYKEKNML